MKLPTIKQLLSSDGGGEVAFVCYVDRTLWYGVHYQDEQAQRLKFEFPVPIDDADGAVFLASDKRIFFMRWMRKHLAYLAAAQTEASAQSTEPQE